MLKESVEYWEKHDFPTLKREGLYHFVMFRTRYNTIGWKNVSALEWSIIQLFQNGASLEGVCEQLENYDDATYEIIEKNIQGWIQTWICLGWLTLSF